MSKSSIMSKHQNFVFECGESTEVPLFIKKLSIHLFPSEEE